MQWRREAVRKPAGESSTRSRGGRGEMRRNAEVIVMLVSNLGFLRRFAIRLQNAQKPQFPLRVLRGSA